MRKAYTVVGWPEDSPHLNVGETFLSKEQAEDECEEDERVVSVITHIDDFESCTYGYFTVRTDLSHEMSFVVVDEGTLDEWGVDSGETAFVGTRIRDPSE